MGVRLSFHVYFQTLEFLFYFSNKISFSLEVKMIILCPLNRNGPILCFPFSLHKFGAKYKNEVFYVRKPISFHFVLPNSTLGFRILLHMFPYLDCIQCLVRLRSFAPKISGRVPIRYPAWQWLIILLFKVPLTRGRLFWD